MGILSEESVQALCSNTLPEGRELALPFALDAAASSKSLNSGTCRCPLSETTDELYLSVNLYTESAAAVTQDVPQRGTFGVDPLRSKTCRPANSCQGHGFGLSVAVVMDPDGAGLHPLAKGTCWWQGIMSTFIAFNLETDIGCLVLAQKMTCFTRQQALAHVINFAHIHYGRNSRK